jgi:hypothetical protein
MPRGFPLNGMTLTVKRHLNPRSDWPWSWERRAPSAPAANFVNFIDPSSDDNSNKRVQRQANCALDATRTSARSSGRHRLTSSVEISATEGKDYWVVTALSASTATDA